MERREGYKKEYQLKREKLMEQEEEYRKKLGILDTKLSDMDVDSLASIQVRKPDSISACTMLTKELVDEWIERVDVYGEDRIEIIWRFKDITQFR